jgi:hypothetical protein
VLREQAVRLPGHVLQVSQFVIAPFAAAAAEKSITLTATLNWSDPAGFEAYAAGVAARKNPTLSLAELTARYGPTAEAYQAVIAYLERSGFTLVEGSANRLTVTVQGTRARAEQAFAIKIRDYQLSDRTFYANDQDPAVTAEIAPFIRSISGLNDLAIPRPAAAPSPPLPQMIAVAYGPLPLGINGQGQTIALVEYDNYFPQDVVQWLAFAGLPQATINQLRSVGANVAPSGGGGTQEALGDIAAVFGMAPGANVVTVIESPGTPPIEAINAALNQVLSPPFGRGGIVSYSWNQCEREVSDSDLDSMQTLVRAMTTTGTSFFASSGDNGPTCVNGGTRYANRVNIPAGVPDAVAVGGTTLQVTAGNAYSSESWWSAGDSGGGFGASWHFPRPGYQTPFTSGGGRSIPDVSADADPNTGINICQAGNCGIRFSGTSLASPIWAGAWALACQAAALGPFMPCPSANAGFLYSLKPSAFNPPAGMSGISNDFVHLGLGSPNLLGLVSQVAGPPLVASLSPASGPMTGGTGVTINGSNFIGVTSVVFEGAGPAPFFINASAGQIIATSPALASPTVAGLNHVVVTTPAGASAISSADVFTYQPVVTGVSPSSGPIGGGTAVTVAGIGMGKQIAFDGTPSPNVFCSSDTQCIAASPPHPPGTVDVTVGGSAPTPGDPRDKFKYEAPGVKRIEPMIGPEQGGIYVYVYGSGFGQGIGVDPSIMSIDFCPDVGPCTSSPYVTCDSSTECFAWVPPGSGTVDIVARAGNGVTSERTAADRFKYAPFPTVTSISPVAGSATGGTRVGLTGTNFSTAPGGTTFNFGPAATIDVSCDSTTHCTAASPPGTGTVDITATVGGVTGDRNSADTFAYVPVVTGVSPANGPAIGGTNVTVTGAGFTNRDPFGTVQSGSVAFGGSAAAGACSSASTCQVTSPAGAGTVDVTVTTGDETSAVTPAGAFAYDPPTSPKGWAKWSFATVPPTNALAYDAQRNLVVSFGSWLVNTAVDNCPPPDELPPGSHCHPPPPKFVQIFQTSTWAVDGNGWTQLSPPAQPQPAARGQSMSFHGASGKIVLFGGQYLVGGGDPGQVGNTTWLWDGAAWSDANLAVSPPPRFNASMTYDAARRVVVLFGGCSTPRCSARLNDTWTWDGQAWKQQTPAQAPSVRSSASLAFDEISGKAVLFGGEDANGFLGDTWLWDGVSWTQEETAVSPTPRSNAGMAGTPAGVVLFAGTVPGLPPPDTWAFRGGRWVQLRPSVSPAAGGLMAFDASKNMAVCLCGSLDGETWTWGGE